MMSLEEIVEREFESYPNERRHYILEQLGEIGIHSEKDIHHISTDLLIGMKFKDVEKKKLIALREEYEQRLCTVIKKMFKEETGDKIDMYRAVLKSLNINQADHLPLSLNLIDSCPEIQDIDKRKIKQYVSRNFKEDYEEYLEKQRRDKEDEKCLKSMKHEIITKKIEMFKTVVDSTNQERQQIMDHNQELLKIKENIIKNERFLSFLSNDKGKIKNLDEIFQDNERRKNRLDDKNNESLHQLDIMCQNYEKETLENNCNEDCSEKGGFAGNNCAGLTRDANEDNHNGNQAESWSTNENTLNGGEELIYEIIQKKYNMLQHFVPFDANLNESLGFFFASKKAEETDDMLLVLIYGSGRDERKEGRNLWDANPILCIDEAFKEGYEVLLINTSQNKVNRGFIRDNEDAEQHALYVWDNFIMGRVKAKHIAIMAHSYGGVVTVSLANQRSSSFLKRVFAVGFYDSEHSGELWKKNTVTEFFEEHAKNWVPSGDELDTLQSDSWSAEEVVLRVSAGHRNSEFISEKCLESMFQFFGEELKKKKC